MNISIFTILTIVYIVLWINHLRKMRGLLNTDEQLDTLWIYQLWFYQFMATILIIADVFYFLIKDMK